MPDYRRGSQQPIRNLSIAPMPGHPGRWQGQFELDEPVEIAPLLAWCEHRRRLGMPGMQRATIRWADFHRGVTYEYIDVAWDYDGQVFGFDNAKRSK